MGSLKIMDEDRYAGIPRLEDYSTSPTFGFVDESPTLDLPAYFQPWVELATNLEELLSSGKIRERIHQMPLLDHTKLESPGAHKAANVCLTALTQAYVWCEGEDGIPEVLPSCIAVPFATVSEYLQITPSITSYGFGLINWKLKDPEGKLELENLETLVKLCGGSDESWFFCTVTQVELDFAPALNSIIEAQKAAVDKDIQKIIQELQTMEGALQKMTLTVNKIFDGCRPHVFYNVFRPFLAGWDAPAFRKKGLKGLIYEGVSEEPLCYTGGSAAQSSTLPCLDAALGVTHLEYQDELCETFQQYMPKPHRDLIRAIKNGPSIKDFVQSSGSPDAAKYFNNCLMGMKSFRESHLQIVTRYIIAMSQKANVNKKYLNQHEAGTGGSGFMTFLKGLRDATISTMLGRDFNENYTALDAVTWAKDVAKKRNEGEDWTRWRRYLGSLTVCVVVAVLAVLIM